MNCLLCQQNKNEPERFTKHFLFKQREESICKECRNTFEPLTDQEEKCTSCSKKSLKAVCEDCEYWRKKGETVNHVALYTYNKAMEEFFKEYKFQGDYLLRKIFSNEIKKHVEKYKEWTVVPIPVSHERFNERGFNQVEGLLDAARVDYLPILRKKHSEAQSKRNRSDRLKNVQEFYLSSIITENELPKKILLVDDIYTTGATIRMAKGFLMKKGVKQVKSFSLAR